VSDLPTGDAAESEESVPLSEIVYAKLRRSLMKAELKPHERLKVRDLAQQMGNTRSAAALELWRPHLAGALVAIGNAPTALFHLLNMLEDPDCPRPAAIIGCPVGFVGAAESKEALMQDLPVPSMIVQGRLGGSAITVAAVNALATWKE
jgi:precorrin-8X/cobalt-precorrin-8 methylmutase